MTRRRWILALAVGLGACGQFGCLPHRVAPEGCEAGDALPPPSFLGPLAAKTPALPTAATRRVAAPDPAPEPSPAPPEPPEASVQVVEAKPPPPPAKPGPPDPGPEVRIVAASTEKPEPPLVLALRGLLEKKPADEVLGVLEHYDPADRDVLRDVLRLAARLGEHDHGRSEPQEAAAAVDQLETLLRELRPRAALVLDKLCFCRPRSVDNFGIYEPLEDGHAFRPETTSLPGERVQVYAEVRNFTSRPAGDSFETVLRGQLTIHDGRRDVVTFNKLEPCTDRSRTPRQDFFVNFAFYTPRLPPGSYTLWVQVEDVTPGSDGTRRLARVARRSLDFRVAGDAAPVAAGP
jgi:hypothetical protein